jgi:hypothetical protein
MTVVTREIIQKLQAASHSLLMMSESDFPFEVVLWEGVAPITKEKVLQLAGAPSQSIEVVELDNFFHNCIQVKDWYGEEEKQEVSKFQKLVKTLKTYLSNISVYRLGTIDIDVLILGNTQSGDIVGLRTKLIET